jgi:hypothetical protein
MCESECDPACVRLPSDRPLKDDGARKDQRGHSQEGDHIKSPMHSTAPTSTFGFVGDLVAACYLKLEGAVSLLARRGRAAGFACGFA